MIGMLASEHLRCRRLLRPKSCRASCPHSARNFFRLAQWQPMLWHPTCAPCLTIASRWGRPLLPLPAAQVVTYRGACTSLFGCCRSPDNLNTGSRAWWMATSGSCPRTRSSPLLSSHQRRLDLDRQRHQVADASARKKLASSNGSAPSRSAVGRQISPAAAMPRKATHLRPIATSDLVAPVVDLKPELPPLEAH